MAGKNGLPFAKARSAVMGVGYSRITRDPLPEGRILGDECVEACKAAIADAGISIADVDGITSFYENMGPDDLNPATDGVTRVSLEYLWRRLGLNPRWGEINNKFVGGSLIEANNAIAAGAARFVLVWRAVDDPRLPARRGDTAGPPQRARVSGDQAFKAPYGPVGGMVQGGHAQVATRYFHEYGATREHMANHIVRNRRHALMNEKSYWSINKPEQLSVDDYLNARMIADPLCLYDCDIPVRGCIAYVLGPAEVAQDLDHGAAYIKGFAQYWIGPRGVNAFYHSGGRQLKPALDENDELPPVFRRHLWDPMGLDPSDMSTINVYDGFSIISWLWLEALGICGVGEAFEYVQGDHNAVGGKMPLNTSGGHLAEGALAGAPHYAEAALQAMGRAGVRQVENCRYALAATDRPSRAQVIVFSSQPD
jgi:acetyl-CoA acetyltransferase